METLNTGLRKKRVRFPNLTNIRKQFPSLIASQLHALGHQNPPVCSVNPQEFQSDSSFTPYIPRCKEGAHIKSGSLKIANKDTREIIQGRRPVFV